MINLKHLNFFKLEFQKRISKLQYAIWNIITITTVILLLVFMFCVFLSQLFLFKFVFEFKTSFDAHMRFNIRKKSIFFLMLLKIEITNYTFVFCLYFKYYRSIQMMTKFLKKRILFSSMTCCDFSTFFDCEIIIKELYSITNYFLLLDIKLVFLISNFIFDNQSRFFFSRF